MWGVSPPPTVRALKFSCLEAQSLGIEQALIKGGINYNLQYSTDGTSWQPWDITTRISFGNGVDLYIRGMNTKFSDSSTSESLRFTFSTNGLVDCTGNVMHLFDYTQDLTEFPVASDNHGLFGLFYGCTRLKSAPSLPATSVGDQFYQNMFRSCSNLVIPPDLPATTLGAGCYDSMFRSCTSLVTSPALPATTLATGCYRYMFRGCTALVTIPALLATTLISECYQDMFRSCSAIKMSTTQDSEYQNEFTFGAPPSAYAVGMFTATGGSFAGTPNLQTYYTANTIIT